MRNEKQNAWQRTCITYENQQKFDVRRFNVLNDEHAPNFRNKSDRNRRAKDGELIAISTTTHFGQPHLFAVSSVEYDLLKCCDSY